MGGITTAIERVENWFRIRGYGEENKAPDEDSREDSPGLVAHRKIRYIPSANCGIVNPQKNDTIILFLSDIAYILAIVYASQYKR